MADDVELSAEQIAEALRGAGKSPEVRSAVFEALRRAQNDAADPSRFKNEVRWPVVGALMQGGKDHTVRLANGLQFTVSADSRIERALLLSDDETPDHVWEPQTTRVLVALGRRARNVVIGGAYIGDHALFIARAMADDKHNGRVHAFEPMDVPFNKMLRNIATNELTNVVPQLLALWSTSKRRVRVDGPLALASSQLVDDGAADAIDTITIDDYAAEQNLAVDLIMLDTEGGEEEALHGAAKTLANGPDVVFEIHRSFVDWSDGLPKTSVVKGLTDLGYEVFAIRDFHDNRSMAGQPIELVPAGSVYLEGPPHGFNMLATRRFRELEKLIDLRIVKDVSPKLLLEKDPRLHHPFSTLSRA